MGPVRRRLNQAAAALLAGAAASVVAAWVCAVWIDVSRGRYREVGDFEESARTYWKVRRRDRAGAQYVFSARFWETDPAIIDLSDGATAPSALIPSWADLDLDAARPSSLTYEQVRVFTARGWPMVCLWCEYDDIYVTEWPGVLTAGGGFETPLPWHFHPSVLDGGMPYMRRTLPLRPYWPGLAVNTVFYGAVLGLIISGPLALRRWHRTRRGLCPGCGYPAGGSPLCTECGGKLTLRSRAVT